ncbi:hypothetical protein M0805_000869 [Coniferiporia weirii]|nr:hypothetical protein M0805_000869 [Coniferiporia weirii]
MPPDASKPATPTSSRHSPVPRTSSSSRTGSRAPSPTPSSRARSPLPPTLRPVASFSAIRASTPIPSTSTQRLTATALPAHMLPTPLDVFGPVGAGTGVSLSGDDGDNVLVVQGEMGAETETEAGSETETETEREVEETDAEEAGSAKRAEEHSGDEESRHALREQLRRTLAQTREPVADAAQLSELKGKQPMGADGPDEHAATARQYFVLTDAGKPVFSSDSSALAADQDALASTMGLMQALISVFLDDGDKLRCINAGRTRITFLLRSPLYFACVSGWGEPESVTRSHLEYLHLQILSVVSGGQLRRIFERRTNFDLRRLLSGTETFLHSLLARLQTDLAMSTSSLLCLALDPALRRKAGDALVPSKMKDILYVALIARSRIITLVRPKKHSVHPADLHILLNTVHAPAVIGAPASWLPVCLPKFNSAGFLHAYVVFPRQTASVSSVRTASGTEASADAGANSAPASGHATPAVESPTSPDEATNAVEEPQSIGLGLVCVSGGGGDEFEAIRAWCEGVTKVLESSGVLDAIERAVRKGHTEYTVDALGVPGLQHFVYKSRAHVQVTHPEWGTEYEDPEARRRLITLYQCLHDAIHGRSGQKETLKLQYIRTERESVMGWITQPFELYISVTPNLPKAAVVSAANAVVRWVKKEEARLFLRDAPVF